MPSTLSTDPDLEANLTLEVCLPQPSYDPQDHAERSWAHVGAQDQSVEVDGVYTAVDAMPELDVGIRNDDPHIEEGVDYTIGLAG